MLRCRKMRTRVPPGPRRRFRASATRLALFAAAAFAPACGDAAPTTPPPAPAERPAPDAGLPSERAFLAQIDRTKGTKDCFSVIKDPAFLPADGSRGPHGVTDGETVIGLDLGDAQVCFPTLYLDLHEIVEFRLEGLELLACW